MNEEWFGDWESASIINELEKRERIGIKEPIGAIKEILEKYYAEPDGWRKDIVNWAERIVPKVLKSSDGQVNVSRSSIKNIIAHGKGPLKILTMPHLQEILKDSVRYYVETTHDNQGRKQTFYNYAYPIEFDSKKWVISISIKEDYNGQKLYDDEFIQEIKSTDGLNNIAGPSTRGFLTHPSTLNILRTILSVKRPSEVSKSVDENGEPR